MVSGAGKNKGKSKRAVKSAKEKKPMELAKNKGQLVLSIVILCAFIGRLVWHLLSFWNNVPAMGKIGIIAGVGLLGLALLITLLYIAAKAHNFKAKTPPPVQNHLETPTAESVAAKPEKKRFTIPSVKIKRKAELIFIDAVFLGVLAKLIHSTRVFYLSAEPNQKKFVIVAGVILAFLFLLCAGFMVVLLLANKSEKKPADFDVVENDKKPSRKFQFAKNKGEAIAAILILTLAVGKISYSVFNHYQKIKAENQTNEEASKIAQSQQNNLMAISTNNINPTPDKMQEIAVEDSFNPEIDINGKPVQDKTKQMKQVQNSVTIPIETVNRANPFMPYSDGFSFDITSPPTSAGLSDDASKVMQTTISGIMYDKYSPSAILNIEGSDYLVKKGDIINGYHILNIYKDQVAVQLGKNIYKAGVGQILASGEVNYNNVYNLNHKFGGNKNVDVIINVKKKGY